MKILSFVLLLSFGATIQAQTKVAIEVLNSKDVVGFNMIRYIKEEFRRSPSFDLVGQDKAVWVLVISTKDVGSLFKSSQFPVSSYSIVWTLQFPEVDSKSRFYWHSVVDVVTSKTLQEVAQLVVSATEKMRDDAAEQAKSVK